MLFGHNSNVTVGGATYHVQTEDRGASHALIDTTVYLQGRVLHRRTNSYSDLLPLNPDREQSVRLRVAEQHRSIIEEIRKGALHLALPRDGKTSPSAATPAAGTASKCLRLELLNAKTWLSGKRALLQVAVRNHANKAVEGAKVTARVDGAAERIALSAETGSLGRTQFEFDMPRLSAADPALVIEAVSGDSKGQLRFHLRAKPHVPLAG